MSSKEQKALHGIYHTLHKVTFWFSIAVFVIGAITYVLFIDLTTRIDIDKSQSVATNKEKQLIISTGMMNDANVEKLIKFISEKKGNKFLKN